MTKKTDRPGYISKSRLVSIEDDKCFYACGCVIALHTDDYIRICDTIHCAGCTFPKERCKCNTRIIYEPPYRLVYKDLGGEIFKGQEYTNLNRAILTRDTYNWNPYKKATAFILDGQDRVVARQ